MEAFRVWADGWSRAITEASVPQVKYEQRQAKDWVTARFDYALIAVAGYMLLCVYGIVKKSAAMAKKKQQGEAAKGKEADDGSAKSFGDLLANFPKYAGAMANDPLKILQTLHNIIQVSLSVYMAVAVVQAARGNDYGIVCNPFDVNEKEITWVTWVFYMSKLYDFVDTIFIVARGKWDQFSFLHTYHHASIFLTYWWVINTAHTGDTWFPVLLNSVIHAIMYFYYLLTCFSYRPWWGKNLTQMQMTQFCAMMTQGVFILAWDCPFPHQTALFYVLYIGSMLLLFGQFYIRKHCGRKAATADGKEAAPGSKKGAKTADAKKAN